MSGRARISAEQFTRRIEQLCLDGESYPRKRADRLILLHSMILPLDRRRAYSETEINAALDRWTSGVGARLGVDHVTLRRYLVDEGFLVRDAAGGCYQVGERGAAVFEPLPATLDCERLLDEARRARARKRDAHRRRQAGA